MSIPRVNMLNRVASKFVALIEHSVRRCVRSERVYEVATEFAHKLDNTYSEEYVLCDECCKAASYVRRKKSLDLKTCDIMFDVISDVLWHLGVSSKSCSHKAARTIVYEMTYTNWLRLNRSEDYFNGVTLESLYDNLASDLTYFSDRWGFNRLLRIAYRFSNVLIQENVDVYDVCFGSRFHKVRY